MPTMQEALTLDQRMQDFGMDPNAKRLSILPYPQGALTGQQGPIDWSNWTAPQWAYDTAKAAVLPGHVAQGGQYNQGDVTNMGLALMGTGATAGVLSGVPKGSLGMGAGSIKNIGKTSMNDALGGASISPEAMRFMAENGTSVPKKMAERMRKSDVFEGSSSDITDTLKDIRGKQKIRSESRVLPGNADPLIVAKRTRPYRAKKIAVEKDTNDMSGGLWGKKFLDDVITSKGIEHNVEGAVNRANMEAVPRALKKEGWTIRHGSVSGGRKSSRYVVSPDGKFEVRLSDHYLPDTPQRAYSQSQYGTRWNDEIVLSGAERPQEIISEIKHLYMSQALGSK